jgi:hypothetical protein
VVYSHPGLRIRQAPADPARRVTKGAIAVAAAPGSVDRLASNPRRQRRVCGSCCT